MSLGILFYCYIGYGLLLWLYNNIKVLLIKEKGEPVWDKPPVTIIIAAFNEGEVLLSKIRNTLAIDYPKEKLNIILVTDGSTDGSPLLVKEYDEILLLHHEQRQGKYAALKRAMLQVQTPFVVFSDANTMLNADCLNRMMPHFNDEKTGGVAGEKKVLRNYFDSVVGDAEGLYWQYESFLKKMDASFYTCVGAAGELFAIRTHLFKALPNEIILDDFFISMQVCLRGFKMAYEPDAFATEPASASLSEEAKRKIRISAGAYQSIGLLKECLNIFKHPVLSFQFISRRVLRWILCPLSLLLIFAANIFLVFQNSTGIYSTLLWVQTGFYAFALLGWGYAKAGKHAGIFTIPFYFVFMNYCLIKGFFLFSSGKHSVLWEKSLRQTTD